MYSVGWKSHIMDTIFIVLFDTKKLKVCVKFASMYRAHLHILKVQYQKKKNAILFLGSKELQICFTTEDKKSHVKDNGIFFFLLS